MGILERLFVQEIVRIRIRKYRKYLMKCPQSLQIELFEELLKYIANVIMIKTIKSFEWLHLHLNDSKAILIQYEVSMINVCLPGWWCLMLFYPFVPSSRAYFLTIRVGCVCVWVDLLGISFSFLSIELGNLSLTTYDVILII